MADIGGILSIYGLTCKETSALLRSKSLACGSGAAYIGGIMFGLGVGELTIILVIVLIVFGAGKLPDIGEGLGKGIRSFRKAVKTPDEIDVTPEEDPPPSDKKTG